EISTQDPAWQDPREMTKHLHFNRDQPQVDGDIYFSAKDVRANRLGHMDIVQSEHYAHPALLPVTADVPGRAPRAVKRLDADRNGDAVRLSWRGDGSSYAVYRIDGRPGPCDLIDATNLVATVRNDAWVDRDAPGHRVTYVVTALDRAYRESPPARAVVGR
ncbi:MAG TPA: glycosyl hydrolase, partial [Nocardioides sp.]|nr:glycosyl hydrolase [Nocardioides sp.]